MSLRRAAPGLDRRCARTADQTLTSTSTGSRCSTRRRTAQPASSCRTSSSPALTTLREPKYLPSTSPTATTRRAAPAAGDGVLAFYAAHGEEIPPTCREPEKDDDRRDPDEAREDAGLGERPASAARDFRLMTIGRRAGRLRRPTARVYVGQAGNQSGRIGVLRRAGVRRRRREGAVQVHDARCRSCPDESPHSFEEFRKTMK